MFLPTTPEELKKLGWDSPDIIIVSGDTYIDSPFMGASLIARRLSEAGFKVGIIAQPGIGSGEDITRLGEPKLFWGITAGATDSMVANYTASGKRRKSDDFTPGGINDRRPDRATIAYTNLIRRYFKNTAPIILGGVEASLRRVVHYDFHDNALRRPILFDSKADILVYGMGERAVLELAEKLTRGEDFKDVKGICYISKTTCSDYITLPSFEAVKKSKEEFIRMFQLFYENNDPLNARGLCQKTGDRFLVQNPPADHLTSDEVDAVYDMDFTREVHPCYLKRGKVKAQDTIKFSLTTHRGCIGECNFCSITVHQGRRIISRSRKSVLREAKKIAALRGFRGYITDAGGPTANMYKVECKKKSDSGNCIKKRCLYPHICPSLNISHKHQIELLKSIAEIKGVKKVFLSSGIRHDIVMGDKKYGNKYLKAVIENHTSGQLKIAPEHTEDEVLEIMGKCGSDYLEAFRDKFYDLNKKTGKKQFLTYYIIAAHPGCREDHMRRCAGFFKRKLGASPEQVQIFTPTPSTYSTLMYYTGLNPFTGEKIFTERSQRGKENQKRIFTGGKKRK